MKKLIYVLAGMLMVGCSTEDTTQVVQEVNPELYSSDSPTIEIEYNNNILEVQEKDGVYIYEGDILIDIPTGKSAIKTSPLWENNTIPYSVASNVINPYRIDEAIKHWESKTAMRFVRRTTETNYVEFIDGSGCSSYVGRIGGRQVITLASSCSVGSTIHEIGHAVGLWHEQSRVDRDKYMIIHWGNITAGREHNFNKWNTTGNYGIDATPTLDFGSIMIYGSYSFSSNGQPTITKLDGSTYTAQRTGLSAGDIYGVNLVYPGAPVKPEPTTPEPTEPEPTPTEPVEPVEPVVQPKPDKERPIRTKPNKPIRDNTPRGRTNN